MGRAADVGKAEQVTEHPPTGLSSFGRPFVARVTARVAARVTARVRARVAARVRGTVTNGNPIFYKHLSCCPEQ